MSDDQYSRRGSSPNVHGYGAPPPPAPASQPYPNNGAYGPPSGPMVPYAGAPMQHQPPQGYPMQQGYPPPYAAPMPAPINIVVQNTNVANAGGGGIVRTGNRSRALAAVLAFVLGGIGVHKFYLGQTGMGIVYLLGCWTFIPAFIAFFEGVGYLLTSEHAFDMKYNARLA